MASRYIEINLKPGLKRKMMGRTPGLLKTLGGGTMKLKLTDDKRWEMMAPFPPEWRYYVPDVATGPWITRSSTLVIKGPDDEICFEIWDSDKTDGTVSYGKTGGFQGTYSTWQRVGRPMPTGTGCWSGLALKGSAGVVLEGEEVVCLVRSFDNPDHGAWFNVLSGRLGLVGGFSGGVAFVLLTGFPNIDVLHNFSVSGWDWTLSVGAKFGSLIKFGSSGPRLLKMIQGINRVEDLIKAMKAAKNDKEIIGMGKSVYDNFGLDFEEPKVTVIDVPMLGAGAEAGIYVYAGNCSLMSKW